MTDESPTDRPGRRFLTLKDVQDELQVSASQAISLVRSGQLRAIQIGGRGQWRIERARLEDQLGRLVYA